MTDKKETQSSDKTVKQDTLILTVEEVIEIPDGKHEGIIVDVTHREDPFGYIDVFIKEKVTGAKIKVGFPDKITETTALGKFLVEMGYSLYVGELLDLKRLLLSQAVTFSTVNEETDKGVFARVIRGSIKPKK